MLVKSLYIVLASTIGLRLGGKEGSPHFSIVWKIRIKYVEIFGACFLIWSCGTYMGMEFGCLLGR